MSGPAPQELTDFLTSSRRRPLVLLAAFAAVSVLTRLVVAYADVINVDEASYMVGASEMLRGHLPYSAFGDNKPPLIYVYYALAQLVAGHGIGAVRLVTALVTVPLTALAVSAFYRHDRRGAVGGLLFLLYSASYTASDMLAVNCEVVMMLPLAWALVAVRSEEEALRPERAFLAGLLVGTAALVKYQAVLWLPALAVAIGYLTWQRGQVALVRSCASMALGVALPVLATIIVFAVAGGLEGLIYWNVTHNIEYLQNPVSTMQAIWRGFDKGLPFLAVTVLLWVGWFRSSSLARSTYWELLVASLIGASAAAACLGYRFFPHYFIQLYVPLAIAAAPWVASLLVWPFGVPGWAVATLTLLVVSAWSAVNASRLKDTTATSLNAPAAAVAASLRADACYSGSSMFVWGSAPEFYYHAELPLATQFFFPEFPLVRYYAGNPTATARNVSRRSRGGRMRHWSRLMADLRRVRPTYIIDTAPAGIARWQYLPLSDYPALHRFTQRHYHQVSRVSGVDIYRRDDCEGTVVAQDH